MAFAVYAAALVNPGELLCKIMQLAAVLLDFAVCGSDVSKLAFPYY